MKKLIAVLFGFATAAATLVPVIAEAGINLGNHSETFVRDRDAR